MIWTIFAIVVVWAPPSMSGVTKSPSAGMNVRSDAATMPGHRQRQRDVEERAAPGCVQVARRLDEVEVEPVDRDEQRQDRERQEAVGHAQDHAEVGVDDSSGLVDEPGLHEQPVHDAVVAQDDQPGVGPDEVARPEREHDQDEQQDLAPPAVPGDPVRDRVADQRATGPSSRASSRSTVRTPVRKSGLSARS